MAMLIGLVRRMDTGEVIRVVYPDDHESDEVLDDPQWVTMGFEHHDCEFEMIRLHKDDPRIGDLVSGVLGMPKVI